MKLSLVLTAGAVLSLGFSSSVLASDLLGPADPIYSSQLFNFEGLYAGVQGGFAYDQGILGSLGIVVGSNFAVSDGLILGVEFQGDAFFDGADYAELDAIGLGRVGGFINQNTLFTVDAGLGSLDGSFAYAFGAGAEFAMTDTISVRGDLQELGRFGEGPSVTKATVGLLFHMQ